MLGLLGFVQSANSMQLSSGWVLLYAVAAMIGVLLGLRTTSHNPNRDTEGKEKIKIKGKNAGMGTGKGGRRRSNSNTSANGENKSRSNSISSSTTVAVTPTRKAPQKREISLDQAMDYYNDNEINIMEISPIRPDTPLKVVFEDDISEPLHGFGYNVARDIISTIGNFFSFASKQDENSKKNYLVDVPLPKFKEIPAPLSLEAPNEEFLLPHDNGRKNGRPLSSIIRADTSSSAFPSPRVSPTSPPLTPNHTYRRCSERISERGDSRRRKGYWKDFYGDMCSDMDSDEGDH